MSEVKHYKVGDKLVEFGQVFRIFKIENKTDSEGQPIRILHFRPYYKSPENKGMICSIPENSIGQTNIREPMSRDDAKMIMKKLSEALDDQIATDIDTVKQALGENDPHTTVRILRSLWMEKVTSETFSKSKKDMFELSTSRLVEELALVIDITPEKTDSKIRAALEKLAA
ncbi:hypothetical protein IPM62_05190 [Candidatus Woesebacteria bacterium]|nr:MAG: hypothetical protein IPM62_05190 [Candidatus Woesebacteria bacterium]